MVTRREMGRSSGSRRGASWCQRGINQPNTNTKCQSDPPLMYMNVLSTVRLRVRLSVPTQSVRAYQWVFVVSVYMDACVFVKLYMHECASQSVCASATVSTPLGLSTKPAQRQMGNFLRGKGKKSGAAAKAAGCVSFPPLLKSDRYRDVEIFTDCERENKGDSLTK